MAKLWDMMQKADTQKAKAPLREPKPKPVVERVAPEVIPSADPAPQSIAKPKSGRGRPLDSLRHKSLSATKPWLALGMSRRTWERRRSEGRLPPPGGV